MWSRDYGTYPAASVSQTQCLDCGDMMEHSAARGFNPILGGVRVSSGEALGLGN